MSMVSAFAVMRSEVPPTLSVLPLFDMPVPAMICPAPENCVKVRSETPRVIEPVVVSTQPEEALRVPSVMKVNMPDVTSASVSASVERLHAPAATT